MYQNFLLIRLRKMRENQISESLANIIYNELTQEYFTILSLRGTESKGLHFFLKNEVENLGSFTNSGKYLSQQLLLKFSYFKIKNCYVNPLFYEIN